MGIDFSIEAKFLIQEKGCFVVVFGNWFEKKLIVAVRAVFLFISSHFINRNFVWGSTVCRLKITQGIF